MKWCNLCGFPIIRIGNGPFGLRCVRCLSTPIHRAMGGVVEGLALEKRSRVYEMSVRGALARFLKKKFVQVVFSEFFEDLPPGEYRGGTLCQDVQALTFEAGFFDLVTCTEVFEHVPDDRQGFAEVARVLKGGGWFVFSVPLRKVERTTERAFVRDGALVHVLPPEYHSDRIRGRGKVLAYRNYGLDILDRLTDVGFVPEMRPITPLTGGIVRAAILVCRKKT